MRVSGVLATCVTLLPTSAFGLFHRRESETPSFDWSSVTPSKHLKYHDCHNGYKCARLIVPLDWSKHANSTGLCASQNAIIAIVTLPATVPDTDPSHGGTILINPGGPSGLGTEMALVYGHYLQNIVDGDRHYEILGFDPRGMGLSTPFADCYNNNNFKRAADSFRNEAMPPITLGENALNAHYQVYKGIGDLCAESGPNSIFEHMSTASVARDMLAIVDRVEELRYGGTNGTDSEDREKPRLQYIGLSYGTVLGNTFASMFPGRVGRMVLDGVADAVDYTHGLWLSNINETETVLDAFYKTCFDAGDACPLKDPEDVSSSDIRLRVEDHIQGLEASPVSAVLNGRVRLVTSVLVRDTIRQSLYQPIRLYEPLAYTLAASIAGNHTFLLESLASMSLSAEEACVDPETPSFPPSGYAWADDAGMGVMCGDSYALGGDRDADWAKRILDILTEQSPTVGEAWARIPLSCSGWSIAPKYAFTGPFGSPAPDAESPDDTPAAPLLILNPRYDHATPLGNALALSEMHGDSAVVIQESAGHCALMVSKSECTARIVREYFATGKVPESGKSCEADCTASIPFAPCPGFIEGM